MARTQARLLSFAGEIGNNPDQRIHQDSQHLTGSPAPIGLLQSTLLLVSFVGVLWVLSEQVVFDIGGRSLAIPGYMVWCALVYSLGGSLLAWRVSPLVALNAERAREADLRCSCASTSTPRASRCTAAKPTSAASWTSRSIAW